MRRVQAGVVAVVAVTALVASAAPATAAGLSMAVWGSNLSGQLGLGGTDNQLRLTAVNQVGRNFQEVSASVSGHSLAIDASGKVWSWGDNFRNELGRLGGNSGTPTQVSGPVNIIDIAAGNRFSLAVEGNGSVWSWGDNTSGQLGDGGSGSPRTAPLQITGLSSVLDVEASGNFALALRKDGTVWGWGQSHLGQTGSPATAVTLPRQIAGLSGIVDIAAGTAHGLALRNDGKVFSGRYGNFGQLGDGTSGDRAVPFQVPVPGIVKSVAAGNYHSLALRHDGVPYSWGYNGSGQLDINNSIVIRSTPTQAFTLTVPGTVVEIEGGAYTTYMRDTNGKVYSCGSNIYGQLGDGYTFAKYVMGAVKGIIGPAKQISAGDRHVLVVTE